ncbi:MAG TPA: ATP-binding protein [Kineosporiaceae bacterium]|nr:ATP-binding protein [Kineosporiaceae bacterium]
MTTHSAGLAHLFSRIWLVEVRVRALVEHRRQDDPAPDDPFRGLYLTDEDVDRLLAARSPYLARDDTERLAVEEACDQAERAGTPSRLRAVQRRFYLSDLDVEILLAAMIPDLDARFERLYGYLNDDVSRRRATIGLALEVAGVRPTSASARGRLAPGAPLRTHRLVTIEDPERPYLSRGLRVPDRVTSHLLGDDEPEAALGEVLLGLPDRTASDHSAGPGDLDEVAGGLARVLDDGVRLIYLRDLGRRTGRRVAQAALTAAGREVIGLDLDRLAGQPEPEELVRLAGREALLRGAGVVAEPVEALTGANPEALRRMANLSVPVLLVGDVSWDPGWSRNVPLQTESPELGPLEREQLWRSELATGGPGGPVVAPPLHLHLGPEQIGRAVNWARLAANFGGGPVDGALLQAGARAQNAAGLERLARRVEPGVGWSDLVLTDSVRAQLDELAARARHRDQVLSQWRMRPGGGRGHGVTALFAGDSGTGKTMSAEVIAAELGLDLYKVDLATVVDKYVGETEKNLERIFSEAAGVNAVLLFDEADAVFGKRSEVRDAHDRYANIESAYLLQRMETFDGLAILSTNLRANIDEAFTRRLDCIIDFPAPTAELRLALWERCLAAPLPLGDDLDLPFCAEAFELTGGNIRSAGITAAYLAAAADRPVGMAQLIAAVEQEYRKLGRLVLEREFGRYLSLLR